MAGFEWKGIVLIVAICLFIASLPILEVYTMYEAQQKAKAYCIEQGYDDYSKMEKALFTSQVVRVKCIDYLDDWNITSVDFA